MAGKCNGLTTMQHPFLNLYDMLGDHFPGKTPPSPELVTSLSFLRWKVTPEQVINTARTAMVITASFFVLLAVIAFALGSSPALFIVCAVMFPLLVNHTVTEYPKSQAKQSAITSLGAAPQIIAHLSTSLKQNPNIELAMAAAAKYGEGEIARDFKRALWRIWTGKMASPFEALPKIADKWGKWSSGFQRSLYLILGSFHERDPKKKAGTLNRAVDTMLNDILLNMREYTLALNIPTLVLFSFGIIMPLVIISLFPLLGFFGIPLSMESITLFLGASLLGSYLYSNSILARRPVTFTLPELKSKVPKGYMLLKGTMLPALPFALAIAILTSFPGLLYLFSLTNVIVLTGPLKLVVNFLNTMPIIWGIGAGTALYLWGTSWFNAEARLKIRKLDAQVPDLLYHIRTILSEGRPLEEALDFAATMLGKTELAEQTRQAVNLIKRRHITAEQALIGPESPFTRESKELQAVLRYLVNSLRGGVASAADTTSVVWRYLTRIRKIDRNLMLMLQQNLAMMRATAMLFAPFVTAVIVALFSLIVKGVTSAYSRFDTMGYMPIQPLSTPALPIPVLQLVVGLYALTLNFVLIRYVTMIQYGSDPVALNMELGKSTAIVLGLFTAALIGLNLVLVGR